LKSPTEHPAIMTLKTALASIFLFIGLHQLSAQAIDTSAVVNIGGIQQFISIQGADVSNPVLLYLHGGPGAAVSAHRQEVTGELEQDFVVVHWDQRNSGQTLQLNVDEDAPTMRVMKQDAEEMLQHLLERFERESLILCGNSWGTVLGFHLATTHPKQVQAFIAMSPIINHTESQQQTLAQLKAHYKDNEQASEQLNGVDIPLSDAKAMLTFYRWETVFKGREFPEERLEEYLSFFQDWESKWMPLYREFYELELTTQLPKLDVPLFILQGDEDLTTRPEITKAYFESVRAPQKELIWFEHTGHNLPGAAPTQMQEHILSVLKN